MGMDSAYRMADELMKQRLGSEAPGALDDLASLRASDVVVTRGQYDHIEQVLHRSEVRHTVVDPLRVREGTLSPEQLVFVNCPGNFTPEGLAELRRFVDEGGFLFTTDWALKEVLEAAFPGYVEFNGQGTADDVVRVEIARKDDPFLASLLTEQDDPQWWLEGSSYPIRILRPDAVEVYLSSEELGEKYGEPAVLVAFDHGKGRVYHMISHFYLQRTEARTARHSGSAYDYLREKGVREEDFGLYREMGGDDVSLSEFEAALSSRSIMGSVMRERVERRRAEGRSPKPRDPSDTE